MADDFGQQLLRFAEKTKENLEDVDVAFKLSLFNRIAALTRVDTGRMRGNWQVSTNTPAAGETGRFQSAANAQIDPAEVAKILPFSATYLTNNVPYILVWEEQDGMVDRARADALRILNEAVQDERS